MVTVEVAKKKFSKRSRGFMWEASIKEISSNYTGIGKNKEEAIVNLFLNLIFSEGAKEIVKKKLWKPEWDPVEGQLFKVVEKTQAAP
ncbi:MAG: hypothetical protein ACRCYP_01645 [Alphaproteobacteria bacterium]